MADSVTAPASFCTQADALLRKNLTFQVLSFSLNYRDNFLFFRFLIASQEGPWRSLVASIALGGVPSYV